ncbi:MAG: hypothetical protein ABIH21_05785 [Patescibacteria group bacterium]
MIKNDIKINMLEAEDVLDDIEGFTRDESNRVERRKLRPREIVKFD